MHNGEETKRLMNRQRQISILAALLLMSSCQHEEIGQGDQSADDRAIRFAATEFKVVTSKAAQGDNPQKRVFLGIAGNDSLFVTASESEAGASSAVLTKSGGTAVPGRFNISVFKDSETAPYLTHMLETTDGWQTYSPTLYWPVVYQHISFFAYSYNLGDNPITPVYNVTDGYSARFDYILPHSETGKDDALVQPDLIMAIAPDQRESEDAVALDFVHTLSSVEFKFGEIGDATIVTSTAKLNGVISEATCTVTHPVSAETVVWTTDDDHNTYSQTIHEGVAFMMIPQDLTESEAAFEISVTIGDVEHTFPPVRLSEITPQWEPNKKYLYTINKGGEVKVDVRDQNTNTYLNNLKIQNTGFTKAYIRASVIGYWYVVRDGVEDIASAWEINDSGTGNLSKPSDWSSKWILKDGIYYYKEPVEPGAYTTPLFNSYELTKTTGPVAGSKLNISVSAQAIEWTKAADFWPAE